MAFLHDLLPVTCRFALRPPHSATHRIQNLGNEPGESPVVDSESMGSLSGPKTIDPPHVAREPARLGQGGDCFIQRLPIAHNPAICTEPHHGHRPYPPPPARAG